MDGWMSACIVMWWWQGRCVDRGRKTCRDCVKDVIAPGCSMKGHYSGLCGGTSFMGTRLTLSYIA